jgi:hypothetical protein
VLNVLVFGDIYGKKSPFTMADLDVEKQSGKNFEYTPWPKQVLRTCYNNDKRCDRDFSGLLTCFLQMLLSIKCPTVSPSNNPTNKADNQEYPKQRSSISTVELSSKLFFLGCCHLADGRDTLIL